MEQKRILVVDDEEDLCEILQYNLSNEGYEIEIAHSAEEALKKKIDSFDLILLDVMMGEMSGFKLADKIKREMKISVPVIFLTAKDSENDILTGFSLGADDYIPKPFSIHQLLARVKAVLKRSVTGKLINNNILKYEEIELDTIRKRLILDNKYIDLSKKEYEILKVLLENKGKVFSRDDILSRVWGEDIIVASRIVDVNITRIRNKLGRFSYALRNKSGYGYYFEL
jgi:two-component system, OmpR family, alkaline phosphatase synthesis response regulator PhoP